MNKIGFELYYTAEEIWDHMLADVAVAKQSIEIEQFSFHDDIIGRKFLNLFEQKLSEGVKIRLLCDGASTTSLFSNYVQSLCDRGLEIILFNKPDILHPRRWFYRIHKKTMIVDSKIAWVGGLGIKDKFFGRRDTQVRLTGAIVADVRQSFELLWQNPNPFAKRIIPVANTIYDGSSFAVNYNGFERKQIYEWMRAVISSAQHRIYFESSYFFPDLNLFQLILGKAREGLDVRIIVRGKNDEFATLRFAHSFFEQCLKNNIKIFRYKPKILHAKTMIIDDTASVGTSNLDKFSSFYNLEANVISSNPEFVMEIARQFFEDLKFCNQLELKDWQKRPILERILELLTWPFYNYL